MINFVDDEAADERSTEADRLSPRNGGAVADAGGGAEECTAPRGAARAARAVAYKDLLLRVLAAQFGWSPADIRRPFAVYRCGSCVAFFCARRRRPRLMHTVL